MVLLLVQDVHMLNFKVFLMVFMDWILKAYDVIFYSYREHERESYVEIYIDIDIINL